MTAPDAVRLADYAPPPFLVEHVDLLVELENHHATVTSRATYVRNPLAEKGRPLLLDGELEHLIALSLDGKELGADDWTPTVTGIELRPKSDAFEILCITRSEPAKNTALEGLYRSGQTYCTQCEAEGFRNITFFPDRPDVMTTFRTTIRAPKSSCPVLLSNGNLESARELPGGRHEAVWHDPFKKPCYLYALVAGDLGMVEDVFQTQSGRDVALRIFVDRGDEDRTEHALESLKKAMAWDEEAFGREYDLDLYMIVAVHAFNFGAMENKGLNIFNSAAVLARQDTATDADFQRIESVIGHEYFHNWSGNRVTLRDWFQLSLKEGFTVFRDQSFSAAMGDPAVQRISDVRYLRAAQFPEDAGPTAHAVRPESYITIDNFYTVTIYEKGAELIRMMRTLLGEESFRAGTDLYFERHDGEAVTTDDFVKALEDASGRSLKAFKPWYTQAGTPVIGVRWHQDAAAGTLDLTLSQTIPKTPGQDVKVPVLIPVSVGLLGDDGCDLPLRLEGEAKDAGAELVDGSATPTAITRVLELTQSEQTFRFVGVDRPARPSVLRGFSAPVRLEMECDDDDLAFRLAHDADGFNRWEAGQRLALRSLLAMVEQIGRGEEPMPSEPLLAAFSRLIDDETLAPALAAETLVLPSESYVGDQLAQIPVAAIHRARKTLRRLIALRNRDRLEQRYAELAENGSFSKSYEAMGRRALKNVCLAYLSTIDDDGSRALLERQLESAQNMTDEISALAYVADTRDEALRDRTQTSFYERWKHDTLVMNKWLAVQAGADRDDVLERVDALRADAVFDELNPNKVRSLYGALARNAVHFHRADGAGYAFLADRIREIDGKNPQLGAQMLGLMKDWRRYEPALAEKMKAEIERILAGKVSSNTFEIATKVLGRS